nr:extended synaptotagmin-1-like [Ipomoea batatas]
MLVADPSRQKLYVEVKDSLGFADVTVGRGESTANLASIRRDARQLHPRQLRLLKQLPPSEASPACISTVMTSTSCLSFTLGVAHFSPNSRRMAIARAHLLDFFMRTKLRSDQKDTEEEKYGEIEGAANKTFINFDFRFCSFGDFYEELLSN